MLRSQVKMAHTYSDKPSRLYHFDIPTSGLVLHASELPCAAAVPVVLWARAASCVISTRYTRGRTSVLSWC